MQDERDEQVKEHNVKRWHGGAVAVMVALSGLFSASPAFAAKHIRAAAKHTRAAAKHDVVPTIPSTLTPAQGINKVEGAIATALNELGVLGGDISSSTTLTTADRSALVALVSADTSGLNTLASTVSNDTTIAQIRTDATSFVNDYRINDYVVPVVETVISIDASIAGGNQLSTQVAPIQAAIATAQSRASGSAALSLLQGVERDIAAIQSDTSGVNSSLLQLTASQIPADQSTITNAQTAATSAAKALSAGRSALSTIVNLLAHPAGSHGGDATTTTTSSTTSTTVVSPLGNS